MAICAEYSALCPDLGMVGSPSGSHRSRRPGHWRGNPRHSLAQGPQSIGAGGAPSAPALRGETSQDTGSPDSGASHAARLRPCRGCPAESPESFLSRGFAVRARAEPAGRSPLPCRGRLMQGEHGCPKVSYPHAPGSPPRRAPKVLQSRFRPMLDGCRRTLDKFGPGSANGNSIRPNLGRIRQHFAPFRPNLGHTERGSEFTPERLLSNYACVVRIFARPM